MTYEEFLKLNLLREDYLVIIRMRYDHEKEYRNTVEVFRYDPTSDIHYWISDWNEGERDIVIDAAVPLPYITPDMIGHVVIA